MDINSKQGGANSEEESATEKGTTMYAITSTNSVSNLNEALLQKDPAKYWYVEARKAEAQLSYDQAAEHYSKAYTIALKDKKSSALPFKWEAERCTEFAAIYKELMKEWEDSGKMGIRLDENTKLFNWFDAKTEIPKELTEKYLPLVPAEFNHTLVSWNEKTSVCKFIKTSGLYLDSEPEMTGEYICYLPGYVEVRRNIVDPDVLFDKWKLFKTSMDSHDRRVAVRRSIKLRYLNVPSPLKEQMRKSSVFKKYIAPAIGNRSVGELLQKYIKSVDTK